MKVLSTGVGVLLPILLSSATIPAHGKETPNSRINESPLKQPSSDYALIKKRHIRFLIGTDRTFAGDFGEDAKRQSLRPVFRWQSKWGGGEKGAVLQL